MSITLILKCRICGWPTETTDTTDAGFPTIDVYPCIQCHPDSYEKIRALEKQQPEFISLAAVKDPTDPNTLFTKTGRTKCGGGPNVSNPPKTAPITPSVSLKCADCGAVQPVPILNGEVPLASILDWVFVDGRWTCPACESKS